MKIITESESNVFAVAKSNKAKDMQIEYARFLKLYAIKFDNFRICRDIGGDIFYFIAHGKKDKSLNLRSTL